MRLPAYAATIALAMTAGAVHAADLRDRLYDPAGGVMVVAHRACHAAVPSRGMITPVPENSLAALERCVALGVDMVEIDVRRTQDGALIVMHDAKVDRTTTGRGKVADLTLGEIQALRLRAGDQASSAAPPTLGAFLKAARGRILVNLDVKDPALLPAVARLVRDVGAEDGVLFKARAGRDAAPIADQPLFGDLAFMPIVAGKAARRADQLAAITSTQASGVRPIPAVELDALGRESFAAVRDAARAARIRVWTNTLVGKGAKGLAGAAGDARALNEPDKAWGGLIAEGVSILQTDQPAALLDYLNEQGLRGRGAVTVADARSSSPGSLGALSTHR